MAASSAARAVGLVIVDLNDTAAGVLGVERGAARSVARLDEVLETPERLARDQRPACSTARRVEGADRVAARARGRANARSSPRSATRRRPVLRRAAPGRHRGVRRPAPARGRREAHQRHPGHHRLHHPGDRPRGPAGPRQRRHLGAHRLRRGRAARRRQLWETAHRPVGRRRRRAAALSPGTTGRPSTVVRESDAITRDRREAADRLEQQRRARRARPTGVRRDDRHRRHRRAHHGRR